MKNEGFFIFTLKSWPVIAAVTIGLCFLTQLVAGLFGVELPDQANIEVVRACFQRAFTSGKAFGIAAFLAAQVLVIMPALEEFVFRGLLFKLPLKLWARHREAPWQAGFASAMVIASFASILFSAAHYLAQPWPDSAFVALFCFGLAQCWLYRRTDRIWCTMLNHALFNLTNLVLLFLLPVS